MTETKLPPDATLESEFATWEQFLDMVAELEKVSTPSEMAGLKKLISQLYAIAQESEWVHVRPRITYDAPGPDRQGEFDE